MRPNDIKRPVVVGLTVVISCVLLPASARAAQHIACPASVEARNVRVDSPDGWTGIYGPTGTLPLQGAEAIFVTGSLRDAWGQLKDLPTTRTGKTLTVKYPLPLEVDKWIVCDYGDRIYQAVKLPPATRECAVTSKQEYIDSSTRKPVYRVSDITCQ
jgi:hypothetical protein